MTFSMYAANNNSMGYILNDNTNKSYSKSKRQLKLKFAKPRENYSTVIIIGVVIIICIMRLYYPLALPFFISDFA